MSLPRTDVVKQTPKSPVPLTQAPPLLILAVETATLAPSAPTPVQSAPPAPNLAPSVPVAAVASPAPALVPVPAPVPSQAKVANPACPVDYISQPKPVYPRMSSTLGEQGTVQVRVLFTPAGLPINAELVKSSGFDRLDKSALEGTKRWRFIVCRGVLAEADHWESAPVRFTLD
jgi:periplasmic protein TonB